MQYVMLMLIVLAKYWYVCLVIAAASVIAKLAISSISSFEWLVIFGHWWPLFMVILILSVVMRWIFINASPQ